jgi:endonuclease YncB( thermonuclease family)
MPFGPYPGLVREVHDGDTAYIDIDLGFGVILASKDWDGHPKLACRAYGINAPELSSQSGKAARDFARALLPVGTRVSVISHGWDKYGGRFDGTVRLVDGTDWSNAMVAAGHAIVMSTLPPRLP